MYIAILGRQPEISEAELERLFKDVRAFSESTSLFSSGFEPNIEKLGGSQKIGKVLKELQFNDWRKVSAEVVKIYSEKFKSSENKITIGISTYDFDVSAREVQKTGLILKSKLKSSGVSVRLVPNQEGALSTATSHHNKLGLSDGKIEIIVAKGRNCAIIAESTGSQNITALAARDQGRPKRDAFVGMLPPKLAQIMINLATGGPSEEHTVLDPFCGTGVLLQEALLLGNNVHGTDLADKMISYSEENLKWLISNPRNHISPDLKWSVKQGDAMDTKWNKPVTAVATETYLGQPFSAPPSPKKLEEVTKNCNYIISSFLKNIHTQLEKGTPLCLAVPAWKDKEGYFTHLQLTKNLEKLGYEKINLNVTKEGNLLYFREDQVVAREILLIKTI